MPIALRVAACTYLALIPLGWSPFPWNLGWADLALVPLALLTLRIARLEIGRFDWLVAAYLAASAIGAVIAADRERAVIAVAKHADVALVYWVFVQIARRGGVRTIARSTAATAGVMSIGGVAFAVLYALHPTEWLAIGYAMRLPYVGAVLRLSLGTGSPAMLGNFLTFALPLALALAASPVQPRLNALFAAAMAATALLTFTHAVAGMAVAVAVFLSASRPLERNAVARALTASAAIAVVLAVNAFLTVAVRDVRLTAAKDPAVVAPSHRYVFQPPSGADAVTLTVVYNDMSYWLLKKIAIRGFLERPWLGHGLGSFHDLLDRAVDGGEIQPLFRNADPHSTWTGRLAETGIVGGVTLAALWAGALIGFRPGAADRQAAMIERAAWAGVLGLAVNSVNTDAMNFRFLWVGLALLRATR